MKFVNLTPHPITVLHSKDSGVPTAATGADIEVLLAGQEQNTLVFFPTTPEAREYARLFDNTVVDIAKSTTFPPSGTIARIATEREVLAPRGNFELVYHKAEKATGIPPREEGTNYIVSRFVLDNSLREDLVAPDTDPDSAIRNEDGQIIAVRAFRI